MTLAVTVLVWALAVAVVLVLATVVVGAAIGLIGLVKVARGSREVVDPPITLGHRGSGWDGRR